MAQNSEGNHGGSSYSTEEWDKDFEIFKNLDIMQAGFEEKKEGNSKLKACRDMAANFASEGAANLSPAAKAKYAEIWSKLYKRPALLKLLNYHYPTLVAESWRKSTIIEHLIENDVSLPTMHNWVDIYASPELLPSIPDYSDSVAEEGDLSKAEHHTQAKRRALENKRMEQSANEDEELQEQDDERQPMENKDERDQQQQEGQQQQATSVRDGGSDGKDGKSARTFSENYPGKRKIVKSSWNKWKVGERKTSTTCQSQSSKSRQEVKRSQSKSRSRSRSRSRSMSPERSVMVCNSAPESATGNLTVEVKVDGEGKYDRGGGKSNQKQSSIPSKKRSASPRRGEEIPNKKMVSLSQEELSKLLEDSSRRGYKQGRREAASAEEEDLVCVFPEALKKKAQRGEFISMQQVLQCKLAYRQGKKIKKPLEKLKNLLRDDEDDDDGENTDEQVKWSQFKSLVPDFIYLYVVIGKHYKKTAMVLIYFRNLIHYGDHKCFTYDSILTGDHEIRSRHQGLDFIWRVDSNAKNAWFLPYTSSTTRINRDGLRSRSGSSFGKGKGPCFRWLQGERCEVKDCRWTHRCTSCKGKEHIMDKCDKKNVYLAKIKSSKAVKPKAK